VTETPSRLTIAYDPACAFCRKCHGWLAQEPAFIPLDFVPTGSPAATNRLGNYGQAQGELVVGDDHGNVWVGPEAFVMCLWATRRWRSMSARMRPDRAASFSQTFFGFVSDHRAQLAWALPGGLDNEDTCDIGQVE
jgi:predicted DCC family thiol-disulfide oxidoreductase YuxK